MFERFLDNFHPIPTETECLDPRRLWDHGEVRGWHNLMNNYSGRGFNDGVYRLHSERSGHLADRLVADRFSWVSGPTYCFGLTWNGMLVALDGTRHNKDSEPMILLFDPPTGDVFEIDETFVSFHNHELVNDPDSSLDSVKFVQWSRMNSHHLPLKPSQIVSYKIPLMLGGLDTIENMDVIDFEVEWALVAQLNEQLRDLPDDTPIRGVHVQE